MVMHDWVEKALELQDKDLRIARLEDQVKAVPAEKARAEAMLHGAEEALQAAKAKVTDEQKAIKHLEIEVDTVNDKRRDFEAKSTMIKDNDDYKAALHQIETCKKMVSDLEDRELVLMEALEEARTELETAKKDYAAAENRVTQVIADLDTREQNCRAQLEKLTQARKDALAEIPKSVAGRYSRLHQSRRGNGQEPLVLAPIRSYNCGFCHMDVPPQIRMDASKGQVVSCPQCGVLLYSEE
jgi:predicted  nucleic acid-binding Zn-ribbon protein